MYLVRYIFCCCLLLLPGDIYAQNLFANPGFEDINNCTEYHADCAPEAWFNIPATNYLVKGIKAQKPVLGNMLLLVPVGNVMENFNNKRRFIYTLLTCPLVQGEKYALSFFIHTGKKPLKNLIFILQIKSPHQAVSTRQTKHPPLPLPNNILMMITKWGGSISGTSIQQPATSVSALSVILQPCNRCTR